MESDLVSRIFSSGSTEWNAGPSASELLYDAGRRARRWTTPSPSASRAPRFIANRCSLPSAMWRTSSRAARARGRRPPPSSARWTPHDAALSYPRCVYNAASPPTSKSSPTRPSVERRTRLRALVRGPASSPAPTPASPRRRLVTTQLPAISAASSDNRSGRGAE